MAVYARKPWRPEFVHGVFAFLLALMMTLLFYLVLTRSAHQHPDLRNIWHLLGLWLVGVNPTAFGYYGFDKMRARTGGRRVPEKVLHALALVGGSFGAYLGMRVFRHKTIKGSFRVFFWLIVLVQAVLVGLILYVLLREHP